MATTLQSPGIQVNVIDESFYTPPAAGTVPMIFVATGQNNPNSSGTGIAQGTTAANAGKVWVITSQRDLTDTFGTPYFETDAEGNPVHGSEINEYGLQAAYSSLGISSKAYVVRADIDLNELAPSTSPKSGPPVAGTYWIDTANSLFGINEWDATAQTFSVKIPLIIDDSNVDTDFSGSLPVNLFGSVGDYAMLVTMDNTNKLFYKTGTGWVAVQNTFDSGKKLAIAPHNQYPDFTAAGLNASTGSVWIKTTPPGRGAHWSVKYYKSSTQTWSVAPTYLYPSTQAAIAALDKTLGGANIPLGTVVIDTDYNNDIGAGAAKGNFKVWIRYSSAPTTVSSVHAGPLNSSTQIKIRETRSDGTYGGDISVNIAASSSVPLGAQIATAINTNPQLINIKATWNAPSNQLSISHVLGGDFEIGDISGTPLATMGFVAGTTAHLEMAPTGDTGYTGLASNFKPLIYQALPTGPRTTPVDGTLWFDSELTADILYNNGTRWVGYKNAFGGSNAAGPIISSTMPLTQSNGISSLVNGDIWVDISDQDMYGKNIYVFDGTNWILQDVTDQTSPNGWVFADARWSGAGEDIIPDSIDKLLTYDYVDPDCPDPLLYPRGTRLYNTRRSGNNIKKYHSGYINVNANQGVNIRTGGSLAGDIGDRWVTASPNNVDGSGNFGRRAQRVVVVKALNAMIGSNQSIRDTDTLNFNLIACPGYAEAIASMVAFNTDIGETAFVIGDTPFRLEPNGTALHSYGSNSVKAEDNNDVAAVTNSTHLAMFYPSGYTNDNRGNKIVVPPSHMMLRTFINSDNKSYLWFAPAGTRRGNVDNATSVGYITGEGEFKTVSLYEGLRNILSEPTVRINPIATLPGVGLVNMGQYTRTSIASSMDRINVSRLVSYLRRQLGILAKPYLFEPNDAQTRKEIKSAAESLLLELVGQRALYDFIVVCDTSNNTPARIDRSELYLDIAIEPVKAVEFIYIPLRLLNTGAIAAGNLGSLSKGNK
jgi:hypothetical protein